MTTVLKPVDVLIVGMGWTGSLMARELLDTGLSIVALERGDMMRPESFYSPRSHDELKFARRFALMQDLSRESITFRNNSVQTALPMRDHGSFTIGEGVGGSGLHWGGVIWRYMPWDHRAYSATVERYGKKVIPENMFLQDWGVSYADLEPFYDRFEYMCAASGKAGNIKGKVVPGGNPFEGPRSREYPLPPLTMSGAGTLMMEAARKLGLNPFPAPAANASTTFVNPDGITYGPCRYCGFCEGFGCESGAKAEPQHTVLPLLEKAGNFELRTRSRVLRVNKDSSGKRAVSVTYVDAEGREFEQPAQLIFLASYVLANVHLLLLSGIGKPYDPRTGKGVIGRNYTYQIRSGASVMVDESKPLNPFMGTGGLQAVLDDYYPETYDFGKHGYIGGGTIQCATNGGRPIEFHPVPAGTPPWGTAWKKGVVQGYHRFLGIRNQSTGMAYRSNYLDLDPTYRDAFGRPMLRMTFDFDDNEKRLADHFADRCAEIGQAIGDAKVVRQGPAKNYSIVPYQSTHNCGGAIMGTAPATSAVNRYLQSWDVSNLFVLGASAFPQNAGKNPTGAVGATTLWAAKAIKERYLKSPGALA